MPRASAYHDAARSCRAVAEQLRAQLLWGPGAIRADDIATGPPAAALGALVEQVSGQLRRAIDDADGVAEICERRADVCEEYERAFARWRHLSLQERLSTAAPALPAPWVDR